MPTSAGTFHKCAATNASVAAKSAVDLREAKRLAGPDSIVVGYSVDAQGVATPVKRANRWSSERRSARSQHFEDWIAAIIFNHLFAGAEAFVSANLWDLPARVSAQAAPAGATAPASLSVSASVSW